MLNVNLLQRLRTDSIKANLLRWLIVPMGVVLIVGAIGDYRIAVTSANTAYDDELLNTALAVFGQLTHVNNEVSLDLPQTAQRVLMLDRFDQTYFSVHGAGGQLIAGETDLPRPPTTATDEGHVHYDAVFRGKAVRVTALNVPFKGKPITIEAAQTVLKRQRIERHILFTMLWPELVMAVVTLALVWLGVGVGLRPLIAVQENLKRRSDRDLHFVSEEDSPREIRPVLHALNGFLARLRQSLDAQTKFISNAAHQLRTPLAALQSQVEFGLREPNPSTWRQTLEKIHAGTKRTVRVANQLLALARAEPGARSLMQFQVLDLAALISEVASEWVTRAIAGGKDLGLELAPAWVNGDRVLLLEMVANLVDNAIKYTPTGAQITVATSVVNKSAILEISDDGPGIPRAEHQRVFERFYRLDNTQGEGCGLGLAIVREVVDAHDAHLSIADDATTPGLRLIV